MKTKKYVKPETMVARVLPQAVMAVSPINIATEDDYADDNLDGLVDENGILWAD